MLFASRGTLMLLTRQAAQLRCRAVRFASNHALNGVAIYSDKAILAINKPRGVESQLGSSNHAMRDILVDLNVDESCQLEHPMPAHRLDKNTTGVLICGKNKQALAVLNLQFRNRLVEKEYLAIVRAGRTTFAGTKGVAEDYLHNGNGFVSVVKELAGDDRLATTSWELLGSSPIALLSLISLRPKTGFKHQLRAQMSSMGAPILGDDRYSKTPLHPSIYEVMDIPSDTMFLHAARCTLDKYRKNSKPKRFRLGIAAPVPSYFIEVCAQFRLPLDEKYITGGVYVDESRVGGGVVDDIGGRWLLADPVAHHTSS